MTSTVQCECGTKCDSCTLPWFCKCGVAHKPDGTTYRYKEKREGPCAHLGGEVRREQCNSCKGKVELKIFACELHGECSLAHGSSVRTCATCGDYAKPPIGNTPEGQALSMMKAPGDKRPGVWRGGVLQIHVGRSCDLSCCSCTQGSNLAGPYHAMTPEQFEVACQSLWGYFGVVGVFGGNPAVSKYFPDYCRILQKYVPFEQRGLWCNRIFKHGKLARETFNPAVSNINVHLSQEAYDEFKESWPECNPMGLHEDSKHSPPFVAMKDVIEDETERWEKISRCELNRQWSALIGVFRGELRGWFCEIAGAQSMLHQHDPSYPDTGVPVVPGWWKQGMPAFAHQVRKHCHECGIPLKAQGTLAIGANLEQVSATHADIFKPKKRGREVQLVQLRSQLDEQNERKVTSYLSHLERT